MGDDTVVETDNESDNAPDRGTGDAGDNNTGTTDSSGADDSQDTVSGPTDNQSGGCAGLPAHNSAIFISLLLVLISRRLLQREKMFT